MSRTSVARDYACESRAPNICAIVSAHRTFNYDHGAQPATVSDNRASNGYSIRSVPYVRRGDGRRSLHVNRNDRGQYSPGTPSGV